MTNSNKKNNKIFLYSIVIVIVVFSVIYCGFVNSHKQTSDELVNEVIKQEQNQIATEEDVDAEEAVDIANKKQISKKIHPVHKVQEIKKEIQKIENIENKEMSNTPAVIDNNSVSTDLGETVTVQELVPQDQNPSNSITQTDDIQKDTIETAVDSPVVEIQEVMPGTTIE